MMEVIATLAVLCIGGLCLAFVAVCGLLAAGFLKLLFFPITIAFDVVKYIVMFVVVPIIVFVVIPIVLLVVVPVFLLVLVPIFLGLVLLVIPFLIFGAIGVGILHAV